MMVDARFGSGFGRMCTLFLVWAALFCLSVMGCGGSGGSDDGGGGGGGGPSAVTYTGATTPAEITADNAKDIAVSAYESGATGAAFTAISGLEVNDQVAADPGRPFLADTVGAFERTLERLDYRAAAENSLPTAVESDSDAISGDCGGNASYSIQVNTDTGDFSGNISFNAFCSEGVTLGGKAAFSGSVDTSTDPVTLEYFTLNFNAVTGQSAAESITMAGQLDISISGATHIATMNLNIRDNNRNRVCKIENFQMDILEDYGYMSCDVSGRFYDPDYGYVDLQTTPSLPFRVYDYDDYPSSGQLVLTGKTGTSGGPEKARLTAIDAASCRVEADADGDADYEYDSGPIPWDTL
jgi:hypothetical protein